VAYYSIKQKRFQFRNVSCYNGKIII